MSQPDTEIETYLARYAATLTAFDAPAAAELWATPGMIVDDRFAGVLEDHETMIHGLRQSYPLYEQLGLASVGHECLDVTTLTDRISLVHVRWTFRDADGTAMTDSTAYYLLRRDDDGLRACVCVQVDDAEKLQALAAERGIDLTQFTGSPDA